MTSSSASGERTGNAAAFATAGWLSKTCSTSKDEIFSPRRRIVYDITVLIVDHADLEAFEHRTHQSWLLVLDGRTQYEVCFRGSPAVEQADPRALCEFLVELGRDTGRERDPNRMRGLLRRARPREQDRHHGAQEIGDGRPVVGERSKESRRGKSLLEANGRAGQKGLIKGIERIGMKQRQARAEDIVRAQLQE